MVATDSSTAFRSRIAALIGLACAVGFLALGYGLIVEAPRAPGDYLLSTVDATGRVYSARTAVSEWLIETLELWTRDVPLLRRWVMALVVAGIAVLACAIPRARGASLPAAVLTLGVFGFWPWLRDDPTELASAGHAALPLLLAIAVLPRRLPVILLVALLAGAASAALVGPRIAFGELAFVAVLVALRSRATNGLLAAVAFAGGHALVWGFVPVPEAAIPAAASFWLDADNMPLVASTWVAQGILAAVAAFWLCLNARGRALQARVASVLVVLVVAATLGAAGTGVQRLTRSKRLLESQVESLGKCLASVNMLGPTIFVNLPLHLRPFLRSRIIERAWLPNVTVVETWDNGVEIHVEEDWSDLLAAAPAIRWTGKAFERVTWEACLQRSTFPLARRVAEDAASFAPDVAAMLRSGALPEVIRAGVTSAAGEIDWEPVRGRRVRIRAPADGKLVCAVAVGAGRRVRMSEPHFLTRGLASGWFALPFDVSVVGEGARTIEWLPGYGVVLELDAGADVVVGPGSDGAR